MIPIIFFILIISHDHFNMKDKRLVTKKLIFMCVTFNKVFVKTNAK
jgi:hypothetical protein